MTSGNWVAHNGYAIEVKKLGRLQEAIEQLQRYIRRRPGNPEALYRLGLLLGRVVRFSESLPARREATRLRHWFPGGWDALGASCANTVLHSKAETAFREVLRIDPGNQNVRRNLERLQTLR